MKTNNLRGLKLIKVGIVGATAYTSRELIKLLSTHPEVEIVHLGGRREGRPAISEIFPSLQGRCQLKLGGLEPDSCEQKPDIAFFTLPHGVSHQYVPKYLEAGVKCIDFSGDYRLKDIKTYEMHYGPHGDAENIKKAVYGIPELFRDAIREARLVANPGCYPTSVILALAPLVVKGLIDAESIIVDSKSGVSGRGNKLSQGSLYCECNENTYAYSIGKHRHTPEMTQGLELLGAKRANVLFAPHLVPMDRGILSTIYVQLTENEIDPGYLNAVMADFYSSEKFIRVLGPHQQPKTKDVSNTNFCDISVEPVSNSRAVVTCAIDNLARGAASQAVQNMNVLIGAKESLGVI